MITKAEFLATAIVLLDRSGLHPSGDWLDRAWVEYRDRQSFVDIDFAGSFINAVALSLENTNQWARGKVQRVY